MSEGAIRLSRIIEAAQGKIPSDLIIRDIQYLDVFSGAWSQGDLAVYDGTIVGVDSGLKSKRQIAGQDLVAVPGFIDAHVHLESSLMMPPCFQSAVLPKGTTTAICDPHELANVQGMKGIKWFLEASEVLDLDLWVMLSSCVPATHLETNGGGELDAQMLWSLVSHPRALGLAEVMNVPGVLNSDPNILKKLDTFLGKPIDGHCPLLRGNELSAYAAAGISSCHESSELEEAREKLRKGIAVWIREGSVAKDLNALAPLLTWGASSIGFCTDDRNPLDIATEGHLDFMVRESIRSGIDPIVAFRAASWSVARHYGLDRMRGVLPGQRRVGALAPGYQADIVLLGDCDSVEISRVLKAGVDQKDISEPKQLQTSFENSIRAEIPTVQDLLGPEGLVHVIVVKPGKIITGRTVLDSKDPAVSRLCVVERYGKGTPPANGYVLGFGAEFSGAIASSVGHDSHNLIAVGKNPEDIRIALAALVECGGGFAVVQNQAVLARLELPMGGLMSGLSPKELEKRLILLRDASRSVGCELQEPFLQLAFLSLPVIPELKLTDKGLVDVHQFRIIDVRAS